MGYWYDSGWGSNIEVRIDPGPNRKNDTKLALNWYRKNHGVTHTFHVERRKFRDYRNGGYRHEDVVLGTPTPEYIAKQKAEQKERDRHHEQAEFYRELFWHLIEDDEAYSDEWGYYRHPYKSVGERRERKPRNAPGRSKPDLSEEDLLEERLSNPRCRYQRGWKSIYRPTRKTWHRHDDNKSWKTHSKGCKSWDK